MSVFRDAVAALTTQWLAAMDDTVTIRTNAAGTGTYNPVTRTYDGTASVIYTGQALVRPRGAAATEYGQAQIETIDYDVYVPGTVTGVIPDHQVTVDATGTTSPELEGGVLTVREIEADTFNARLRLGCEMNRGSG